MSSTQPQLTELLRLLAASGARFVIIGGIAGRLRGSPSVTEDLDICPSRDPDTLERIASVLRSIHARLRGAEDAPFILDGRTLAMGDTFTFATDLGALDVMGTPRGTAGFASLDANATTVVVDGLDVRVAALADLITMKRAAGRPKDLIEVEVLSALRDELEHGAGG